MNRRCAVISLIFCNVLIIASVVNGQQRERVPSRQGSLGGPQRGPPGGQGPPQPSPQARACQVKEKASPTDLQEMLESRLPTTTHGKCLHACMMEELGILKDGKQFPENAIELARQQSNNNPTIVKLATDVTRECANISDPNRCEMAFKMINCSNDVARKFAPGPPNQ